MDELQSLVDNKFRPAFYRKMQPWLSEGMGDREEHPSGQIKIIMTYMCIHVKLTLWQIIHYGIIINYCNYCEECNCCLRGKP